MFDSFYLKINTMSGGGYMPSIRISTPDDYPFIIECFRKAAIPWPGYAQRVDDLIKADQRSLDRKITLKRYVYQIDDQTAGFAVVSQMIPYNQLDQYKIMIYVLPEFRRKGIGTELLNHLLLENHCIKNGFLSADAYSVNQNDLDFYLTCGFKKVWEEIPVVLDLTQIPECITKSQWAKLSHSGYKMISLSLFDQNRLQELYDLYVRLSQQVPTEEGYIYSAPGYENWLENNIRAEDVDQEAWQILIYKEQLIGLKEVYVDSQNNELLCGLMGVLPEFQNQGLAFEMQIKTIQHAIIRNSHSLKSCTAVCNNPMLNLYKKCGYTLLYSWYQMLKSPE